MVNLLFLAKLTNWHNSYLTCNESAWAWSITIEIASPCCLAKRKTLTASDCSGSNKVFTNNCSIKRHRIWISFNFEEAATKATLI